MATVNIANNGWQTSSETSTIYISAGSTYVEFDMGIQLTDEMAYAKACVAIDVSEYKTISFKYSAKSGDGISSLEFGVYDNMTPGNSSGQIGIATDAWSKSGGSVTIDVSNLTGIKYVGFRFYGNTYTLNETVGWSVQQQVDITSLTATEITYTLTYDANGGSGAPNAVSDIRSTTISDVVPTRSSHDFLGWSETKTATYATYFAGNTISLTSNKTLYAVWRKFYTVTYDANGGSSAPSPEKKIEGSTLILSGFSITPPANTSVTCTITFNANGGTCDKNTETITHVVSYTFINWNTSSDGSGTSYEAGDAYSNDSDITLYAQYASTTTYNSTTLPMPTRVGYEFLGWAESKDDASGIIGEYTPDGNIVLYAIWKLMGNVYIYDGTGGFNPYLVFIYDDSGWSQYIPYIYTESGWEIYSG